MSFSGRERTREEHDMQSWSSVERADSPDAIHSLAGDAVPLTLSLYLPLFDASQREIGSPDRKSLMSACVLLHARRCVHVRLYMFVRRMGYAKV